MAHRVGLLVFLHGVLALQMKGVLSLPEESSDSSPGYRKSYYIVQRLPIQRLKERPENAYDRKAVCLPASWPSRVFGAPDGIRPTVSTVARIQLQPVPVIPKQVPSTLAPPLLGSTALRGPVLAPSAQSKTLEGHGEASVPGNLGTYCGFTSIINPVEMKFFYKEAPQNQESDFGTYTLRQFLTVT